MKKSVKLPEWFHIEKYETAISFTTKDWLNQISRRYSLRNLLQQKMLANKAVHKATNPIVKQEAMIHAENIAGAIKALNHVFDAFFKDPLVIVNSEDAFPIGNPSALSVYPLTLNDADDIAKACFRLGLKRRKGGEQNRIFCDEQLAALGDRSFEDYAHLTIDLRANKSTIKKHFATWLKNNARVSSKNTLRYNEANSWVYCRVLPFFDLLLWYDYVGEKKPTQETMSPWLFPGLNARTAIERMRETQRYTKEIFRLETIRQLSFPNVLMESMTSMD